VVQAVVVLQPGKQATEQEIIEHCKKSLAGYKCPKAVAFWTDIPKTLSVRSSRKISKRSSGKAKKE